MPLCTQRQLLSYYLRTTYLTQLDETARSEVSFNQSSEILEESCLIGQHGSMNFIGVFGQLYWFYYNFIIKNKHLKIKTNLIIHNVISKFDIETFSVLNPTVLQSVMNCILLISGTQGDRL